MKLPSPGNHSMQDRNILAHTPLPQRFNLVHVRGSAQAPRGSDPGSDLTGIQASSLKVNGLGLRAVQA